MPPASTRAEAAARSKLDLRQSRLAGLVGFQLRLAQVAIYRDFVAAVGDLGFTPKQYAVLELIAENPGVSQVDLAAALAMDRATMMALVDRLAARDLLERRASTIDRRRQDLFLTAAGQGALARARADVAAHEARLLRDWSDDEVAAAIAMLRRLQQSSLRA